MLRQITFYDNELENLSELLSEQIHFLDDKMKAIDIEFGKTDN